MAPDPPAELSTALTCARAPGLTAAGWVAARRAAEELIGRPAAELQALGIPERAAAWLAAPDRSRLERDRRCLDTLGARAILADSAEFPPLLRGWPEAPPVLFVRGDPAALSAPQLAIVGSRSATPPGLRMARDFANHLAAAGLTITSGLAPGIDAAAHAGALAVGRTIAVLATGIDAIYPLEHRGLAERIVAGGGALVTAFPPGSPPRRTSFPYRNRVLAALTPGTLIVEAAVRSGSLITARFSAWLGRAVFAIPGSVANPLARGCHALIRNGARLVEHPEEVRRELGFCVSKQALSGEPAPLAGGRYGVCRLDKVEKILLDALGFEPASLDSLAARTGLPSQTLASVLLVLELAGRVGLQAGGRYVRVGPTVSENHEQLRV